MRNKKDSSQDPLSHPPLPPPPQDQFLRNKAVSGPVRQLRHQGNPQALGQPHVRHHLRPGDQPNKRAEHPEILQQYN